MKVLDEPPFNGFRAAFEAEERLAASLTVVRLNPALASGPYFGLPPDDLAVAVDQAGQALERWTLLAVIVCSEALLFRDANTRVVRKTKDVVRKPLRRAWRRRGPPWVASSTSGAQKPR